MSEALSDGGCAFRGVVVVVVVVVIVVAVEVEAVVLVAAAATAAAVAAVEVTETAFEASVGVFSAAVVIAAGPATRAAGRTGMETAAVAKTGEALTLSTRLAGATAGTVAAILAGAAAAAAAGRSALGRTACHASPTIDIRLRTRPRTSSCVTSVTNMDIDSIAITRRIS